LALSVNIIMHWPRDHDSGEGIARIDIAVVVSRPPCVTVSVLSSSVLSPNIVAAAMGASLTR